MTPNPTNPSPTGAGQRTRTDAAVAWIVWHAGELAAVGVPLLLALLVSWWFVLLAVLTGAAWAVREVRTSTRTAAVEPAGTSPAELTPADHPVADQPAGQSAVPAEPDQPTADTAHNTAHNTVHNTGRGTGETTRKEASA